MKNKCTQLIIDRVRPLVESGVAWKKIAVAVGVSDVIMYKWRQEGSATYNKEFADMVNTAMEDRDLGKIKAGQVQQAQKHKLKKVTKERNITRYPHLPPSYYQKAEIIQYADEQLDLILDPKTSINKMRYEMRLRVDELIEWGEPYVEYEMVVVKIEEAEVDPNQAAVKAVITNTGSEAKQWNFKEDHVIDASDPLKKLLEEIGGIKKGLPDETKIPDFEVVE